MRDYVGNYRVRPQRQIVSGRSCGRRAVQPLRTMFWKTAGGVVVFAMCTGVVASFWVGQQIQDSLTSIATLQQALDQGQLQKSRLEAERNSLQETGWVEARVAVEHGLYVDSGRKQHVDMLDR